KALGEHDIPLAQATQAFPVKPAKIDGILKIWGEWPAHAPIEILADGRNIGYAEPPRGTDIEHVLDFEITKAPKLRKQNFDDLINEFYTTFKASAVCGLAVDEFRGSRWSDKVEAETFPAEYWLYPDKPIELFYPYRVTIDVEVKDASGTKVEKDIETIVSAGPGRVVREPPYI
ncbi:MAG: hypothetical protein GY771_13895, partial [bacterium]|nr:hypothetical protein [bacterium]